MLGTVNHAGGRGSTGGRREGNTTHELEVLNFRIVNGNQFWGDTAGLLPGPAASLENPSHTIDPQTGEIIYKAEVRLDPITTTILNVCFETIGLPGGMLLGNVTSYIRLAAGLPTAEGRRTPIGLSLVPAYVPCEFPLNPNPRARMRRCLPGRARRPSPSAGS